MGILNKRWSSWQKKAALYSTLLAGLVVMLVAVPVVSQAGEAELKMEIDRLWAKLANIEGVSTGEARGETRPETQSRHNWADLVTISGVVEVEAGVYDDDTVTESDIALATVELGVDAEISEFSSAHVLFLSEDGGGLGVDEAFITIGNTEKNPFYLTAGKMYVPFGNFDTQMISDPLTLELGEAGEDALQVGVEVAGFYASVYAFNGDADDGGDDKIEHYGTNAGFTFESDAVSIDVGGGWISSIQDSDGMTDALGLVVPGPNVTEYVGGYAAHLVAGFGPVTLIGEYVGADDDLVVGTNSQVSAYNVEAGVAFPVGDREIGFAVGFQATDEAGGAFVEERILGAVVFGLTDGTTLALEYLHEEDYALAGGADWDIYTLQLAAEF